MIHEALNNCSKKLKLIIIINENEMSISKNIGRFAKNLSRLRSSHGYFRTKNFKGYVGRMVLFALLSEIPFNLMMSGGSRFFYPTHQNVLFTFIIALLMMRCLDKIREKFILF